MPSRRPGSGLAAPTLTRSRTSLVAGDRCRAGVPGYVALAQVAGRGAPGRTRADREPRGRIDPEHEALLADSVGLALLVVLETLDPVERLAFVLHDMFAVSFEEIAGIVGRSPATARQLASRARRRVQGVPTVPDADRTRQREVFDAFLAAARGGDFDAPLPVLDPNVVLRADIGAALPGAPRSAARRQWPGQALTFSRRVEVRAARAHERSRRNRFVASGGMAAFR
jgi:hypothetical protein